ncbi:MAG: hypothetical protein IIA92_02360 [Chloroflexi bacterium]|nr:hypothetical protein [Chloroflexota bacterium]
MSTQTDEQSGERKRKRPVRSEYLFPAYDLGAALRVTERVEMDGGGTLTEEALAIALKESAKSSAFRLRALTARQFGLLHKNAETLSTTTLAKAIFKPTTGQEKAEALASAFLNIPLFKAVADRFKGTPLPQQEALRNILEREFKVEHDRVSTADRILMDSAREAGVMRASGGSSYLAPGAIQPLQDDPLANPPVDPPLGEASTARPQAQPESAGGLLDIKEEDLADFDDNEFNKVWDVLGMIVRKRGQRMKDHEADGQDQNAK